MPVLRFVAIVLFLVGVCGCDKRDSTFDQECRALQGQLSAVAAPTQFSGPKQDGYSVEASWQFGFQGDHDSAMKAFEARIPASYKPIRRTPSELRFARFDGNDSFYLTFTFDSTASGSTASTAVKVNLRSTPD